MLTAKNIERQLNLFYCCAKTPNSLLLDIVASHRIFLCSWPLHAFFRALFEIYRIFSMENSLIFSKSGEKKMAHNLLVIRDQIGR